MRIFMLSILYTKLHIPFYHLFVSSFYPIYAVLSLESRITYFPGIICLSSRFFVFLPPFLQPSVLILIIKKYITVYYFWIPLLFICLINRAKKSGRVYSAGKSPFFAAISADSSTRTPFKPRYSTWTQHNNCSDYKGCSLQKGQTVWKNQTSSIWMQMQMRWQNYCCWNCCCWMYRWKRSVYP